MESSREASPPNRKHSSIHIGTSKNIVINNKEKKRVLQLAHIIKQKRTFIENKEVRYNKFTKLNLYLDELAHREFGNYFDLKDQKQKSRKSSSHKRIKNASTNYKFAHTARESSANKIHFDERALVKNSGIRDSFIIKSGYDSRHGLFITENDFDLKAKKKSKLPLSISTKNATESGTADHENLNYPLTKSDLVFTSTSNRFVYLDSTNRIVDKLEGYSDKCLVGKGTKPNVSTKNKSKVHKTYKLAQNEIEYNCTIDNLNKDYLTFMRTVMKEKHKEKFPNIIENLAQSSDVYNKYFHLRKDKVIDLQMAKQSFIQDISKSKTKIKKLREELELTQNLNDHFLSKPLK